MWRGRFLEPQCLLYALFSDNKLKSWWPLGRCHPRALISTRSDAFLGASRSPSHWRLCTASTSTLGRRSSSARPKWWWGWTTCALSSCTASVGASRSWWYVALRCVASLRVASMLFCDEWKCKLLNCILKLVIARASFCNLFDSLHLLPKYT